MESLGFNQSLAQPEVGKKIERRRARLYNGKTKPVMVTRRRGRNTSKRRLIEEERHPVMALLAA